MAKEQKDMFSPTTEKENGEITPGMDLISVSEKTGKLPVQVEKEIEIIEKNIELFNKIKVVAIKLTKPSDWVIQDKDSPYLMDRGAENIAIAFGVDISGIQLKQEWAEDDDGRYYSYVATGTAYCKKLNRYIEDIGVCSQRDKFFGKIGREWKPVEQVDMANIRRKAVTNLYNRLIKRVIGLMNLTLDDLKSAGLEVAKVTKIEYGKGTKKAEAKLTDKDLKRRDAIWDICMQMSAGDEAGAKMTLKEHSMFKTRDDGKEVFAETSTQLTTSKWISMTMTNIKKAFKKLYPDEDLPFDEENLK